MSRSEDLVLHTLVIKGFASVSAVEGASGIDDVAPVLVSLAQGGLAQERTGRVAGWAPTGAGRSAHVALLSGVLAAADPALVLGLMPTFAELNGRFKQVCTDWQLRDGAPNDHADPSYDARVVAALGAVDGLVGGVCEQMAVGLARVGRYRARLAAARLAVEAGDGDRFTRPLADSYHDIWMELHQDLLLTLGLSRQSGDL
jgi:hypothetical protein